MPYRALIWLSRVGTNHVGVGKGKGADANLMSPIATLSPLPCDGRSADFLGRGWGAISLCRFRVGVKSFNFLVCCLFGHWNIFVGCLFGHWNSVQVAHITKTTIKYTLPY